MKTAADIVPMRAASVHRASLGRRDHRAVAWWLLFCCAMIFAMVVIGGVTRLTLSGLSITEWQLVTGALPPLSEAAWNAEFEKYKQIPQYRLLNHGMTLGEFKTIYFWEYLHRLWGRLIGFAYALPLIYFLIRRQVPRRLILPLAGVFLLGFAQGALGWYMVKSGLADRISVSQYRLVAHLALALAIYAATLWIALGMLNTSPAMRERVGRRVRGEPGEGAGAESGIYPLIPTLSPVGGEGASAGWRRAAEGIIALIALTIVAGGFVAGLHAGLTYNTFPLMDGSFVPAGYAQLQPFVLNWFENVAAVQFNHRLLAIATAAAVVLLWASGMRAALTRSARFALHALLAAAALQFALGVATLLLIVPVPLGAAHQAGAVVLLTAGIVFRHTVRRPELDHAPRRSI